VEYKNVLTTCVYCGTGCGLYLEVLDGKVVGTIPAKNHPVNEGKLCIKGWNAHAFVHHPERLTTPLIRDKKGGELRRRGAGPGGVSPEPGQGRTRARCRWVLVLGQVHQ